MLGVTAVEGTVVHSPKHDALLFSENTIVCFNRQDRGKIVLVCKDNELEERSKHLGLEVQEHIKLKPRQFLIPGFIDAHIHAPQYLYTGTGYDLELIEWLQRYTFPSESKYGNPAFCDQVYRKVVRRCLINGTTTACYHATIHVEATKQLSSIIGEYGQRALVGKVNMDSNSPEYYVEKLEDSIRGTEEIIDHILSMKNHLIEPVVTPRFSLTCSDTLLRKLGTIAEEKGVKIQTHINENMKEVAVSAELFPSHEHTSALFDSTGLLGSKSIMAHCIHMTKDELELFKTKSVGIVHCPTSNSNIRSGILDTRKMLDMGIKIGLGTDVAGGHTASMMETMRCAVQCSNVLSLGNNHENPYRPISYKEAFYLATAGSAKVLNLEDHIGTLEEGKQFDALVVDTDVEGGPIDIFDTDSLEDAFMKFIYLGDDRNIRSVYVAGQEVKQQLV